MASDPLNTLPQEDREKAVRARFPDWLAPMLATLIHDPFSHEHWIFERKFDGERCLAFRNADRTYLMSRNHKELQHTYPEVADIIARQSPHDFVVDGEIVAFEGELTSFGKLQNRMKLNNPESARDSGIPVYYYVFDILHLDGYDVCGVPLRQRKKLLRRMLDFNDPLRFTEHRDRDGESFFQEVCPKGWEGIIAKDAGAPYVHSRSRKWLKLKCVKNQEVVIGGFTEPQGSRIGLGALLAGYYKDGSLRYAGKIGTGYDDHTLRDLRARLDRLEIEAPPFSADDELPRQNVHWVKPELVAQVKFTEWTEDGRLRHPVYLGLRRDQEAGRVTREEAA